MLITAEVTESGYQPVQLEHFYKHHLQVKSITYFTSEVETKILKITTVFGSPAIWQAQCSQHTLDTHRRLLLKLYYKMNFIQSDFSHVYHIWYITFLNSLF